MRQEDQAIPFPDHNQNFWQLTCIQSAAQGISGILIGHQIAQTHGSGIAVTSICIGNLILWIIGLAIISMAAQERNNAIQNVRLYLGKTGAVIAAVILMTAFVVWYMVEIKDAISSFETLFRLKTSWRKEFDIRIGAAFGLIPALLAIGGIRFIKWTCVAVLPFILMILLFAVLTSDNSVVFKGTWGLSFFPIINVTAIILPGFFNLPTFFRHSRSRANSFLALCLITIFDITFQISTLFVSPSKITEIISRNSFISAPVIMILIFIFLTMICLNLVNIYFVSAGLETILPHASSSKEYALVGLVGTAAYTFFQISTPMIFLENLADNCIASLGIVLLLTFLVRIIVRHRPRPFEKLISCLCWFIGCITAIFIEIHSFEGSHSLVAGICASILSFLVFIFIEETVWSIKHLSLKSARSD